MKKIKKVAVISFLVLMVIGVLVGVVYLNRSVIAEWLMPDSKVDMAVIEQVLEESSELTAAKLTISGMKEFKDSGVKILNSGSFILFYEAQVRAGIDLQDVIINVDENNKIVNIEIPKAKIIDVKIEPSKSQYIDKNFAFFNNDKHEDASKAESEAVEVARKQAQNSGILEMADKQSEYLIKGLIGSAIPDDYEIKCKLIEGK